jgi:hypothetical protein
MTLVMRGGTAGVQSPRALKVAPLLWGVGRHAQQRTRQQRESTTTNMWLCSFFADSTADEAERLIEASATRVHRHFLVNTMSAVTTHLIFESWYGDPAGNPLGLTEDDIREAYRVVYAE